MRKILSSNKNTYIFFLVLSFLFYGNSIKNGFSIDDSYVTVTNYPVQGKIYVPNNQQISKGFSGIGKIWRSHYGYGNGTSYDYRPLIMTMFAIEYGIFGQAPHINHIINIIMYSLVIFYLFLFLKQCLGQYVNKETFALICSILFLAHPIHTEVVNNIKCRDELLALLLVFITCMQMFAFFEDRQIKRLIYSVILIMLALYCKFTTAIIFILIPLILVFFSKVDKKRIFFIAAGLLICLVIYRVTKRALLTEKEVRVFYHFENPLYTEHISLYTHILFALSVFGYYVKLLFWPYPLRFYYGSTMFTTQITPFNTEIIIGVLFVFAALFYCYKAKNKVAFFGLLFFLLSISPLINFISPVAGILGERLCFTASVGFLIFITSILLSHKSVPNQIKTVSFFQKPLSYFTIIITLSLFYIWSRNTKWESEFSLYEHDAQYSEKSGGQNNLLGNKYYEMLMTGSQKYSQQFLIEHILKHYNIAIQNDSSLYSALNNSGVIYFSYLNQPNTALHYFERAIANNHLPYPQAYENLGNCYKKRGDFIQSYKNYRIAIMQNPKQYKSYTELMNMLIEKKALQQALPIIKEADKEFPKDYVVTSQYANYFLLSGDTVKGVNKLEEAFTISPNKKLAEYLYAKWLELKNTEKSNYYKTQYGLLQQ